MRRLRRVKMAKRNKKTNNQKSAIENKALKELTAVNENGRALQNVPEEYKTAELCFEAVRDGWLLQFVTEGLKTMELCLKAVKQNAWALKYVPEEFKTEELCHEAVKKNAFVFEYVPEVRKTVELCFEVVKKDGQELKFVPEGLKTAELCLEAVKQSYRALKYFPEEHKTEELCLEAVIQNREALEFIPEGIKIRLLDYAPEELKAKVKEAFEKIMNVIFWDTETNGLKEYHSVLSISAIKCSFVIDGQSIESNIVERYERFYFRKHGEKIGEKAVAINGLTDEIIRKNRSGADYPENFCDDINSFQLFCGNARHFVGHNIFYDKQYIDFRLPNMFCTMKNNTAILGLKRQGGKPKDPSLGETAKFYGIETDKNELHGSMYDSLITYQIFLKMLGNEKTCAKIKEFLYKR
jgi:DNA polymerase III epsilon subunit-like protein